jgi:hypothetical protein
MQTKLQEERSRNIEIVLIVEDLEKDVNRLQGTIQEQNNTISKQLGIIEAQAKILNNNQR